MYDVSGIKGAGVEPVLKKDWEHIVGSELFSLCIKDLQRTGSTDLFFSYSSWHTGYHHSQINDTSFLQSSAYLHDQGRPVIAIWGMGMSQEQHDVASLVRLIKWIKDVTPGGAYVFAGTPSHWRTRDGDCDTDPEFEEVWKVVDGVSDHSILSWNTPCLFLSVSLAVQFQPLSFRLLIVKKRPPQFPCSSFLVLFFFFFLTPPDLSVVCRPFRK